jgi:outer membrane lipoprotein-sorting protein
MQKRLFFQRRVIILILMAAFLSGCVRQAVQPSNFSVDKTLSAIEAAVAETHTLSALVEIELAIPGGNYPSKAALIIKKPSYMRLELLPPIGTPDFFLTATPEKMKILLPSERNFYEGEPSARNLARFLRWQFNIEDIVAILTSTYPPLKETATFSARSEGNAVRIEIEAPSGKSQAIWVEANRLVKLVRRDDKRVELYSVSFEDHEEGSGLARKITIKMADGITSLCIKYSDIKIEETADLSIFDLNIPAGFRTILLD